MLINLNRANNKAAIKRFISRNLPDREGRRNLRKGLKQDEIQTLTTQMGDRPGVPNVCLILTSAVANDFPGANLSQFFKDVCDHVILLRHGGFKDVLKVPATICPSGKDELVYSQTCLSSHLY